MSQGLLHAGRRIILHLEDAVKGGTTEVSIRRVDSDVAVTSAQHLNNAEVWIAFGTRKYFSFIAAHEIARALGPDQCMALPMFHAFTGCHTMSCFGRRDKRTAWNTWKSYGDVTPALCYLPAIPESVKSFFKPLE